jgi:photosynthetic reaction center cytochrome c subunit
MNANIHRALRPCVLCAALLLAIIASAQQPKLASTKGKPAEEVYKNIKSFKGQSATQLVPTMQFISASLGVTCEFCHDTKAFDADTKEQKRAAREMIAMQEGINKAHFKGKREVTCNSCHHGAQHPAGVPALPELNAVIAEPEHDHDAHKPPQVAPSEYLDEFFKAAGGEAALAKLTSRTERGTVTFGSGQGSRFESYTRANGQRATALALKQGSALSIFDGHTGWLVYPERHNRQMSSGEVEAASVEADFEFPVNFKQRYSQFRVARPESIGGKPVNVLLASRGGQPPVRLFFDAASKLLVRVIYYVETPLGRNPTQIDVVSYADASGIQLPYRWIVTRPASRASYAVDSTDNNTPIDDNKFVQHAEPPPAADTSASH